MLDFVFRSLMAACLPFVQFTSPTDYGVGFDLSLDYGVASVYFSNGSAVDVAKIEGGLAYKEVMRASDIINELSNSPRDVFPNALESGSGASQAPLVSTSPRDYLPPWRSGNDARSQPLSDMLKALKTATESYLGSKISAAEIVMPFPVSTSNLDSLRAASSSVSLHQPMSAQPPAGILAARAYGMHGTCNYTAPGGVPDEDPMDDPEQLILTVDYSRAALTTLLVDEECGVFEIRRVLHNPHLGLDGLRESRATSSDLESALRNVTQLPLKDGNGASLNRISNLVLLGESAGDLRLHDALRRVLGEQYGRLVKAASESRSSFIEPLFAPSRGVAWDCWDRLNYRKDD